MSRITVGYLKKVLTEHDDTDLIAVASDEEGNQFGYPTEEFGVGELLVKGKRVLTFYPIDMIDEDDITG